MAESYRPPLRKDAESRSKTQSVETNTSAAQAKVQEVLDNKDPRIFTIGQDQTLHRAVELLREHRIGALVVTDDEGKLSGILSERDIVRKLADTPGQTLPQLVEDVMTRQVETCTAEDLLVIVLRRMTDGRFRHMPVLDRGDLVGMVTIGDAVNFRLNQLEEEALQIKQLIVG